MNDAVMALAVLMYQLSVEHPRHDLHIAVRMGFEPATGSNNVVVRDQQQPKVGVRCVVMASERKTVVAIEPVNIGRKALTRPADI